MTKSELRSMIRGILKEELLRVKLTEDVSLVDEKEIDACLARVNKRANSGNNYEIDHEFHWAYPKISKEDLKKALRIGSRGTYKSGSGRGVTMPAQLVDELALCLYYYDDTDSYDVSAMLYGEHPITGEDTNEYANEITTVGSKDLDITFGSEDEAHEYFINYIVPNADKLMHEIITQAWAEHGFTDYEGITDYHSRGGVTKYQVVLNNDVQNPIYTGTKPNCDQFLDMIKDSAFAKAYGCHIVKCY